MSPLQQHLLLFPVCLLRVMKQSKDLQEADWVQRGVLISSACDGVFCWMDSVKEMGRTSCLCVRQISKCLMSGCAASHT